MTLPCGDRHLCEACDKDCRGQSYKGNYGLLQEVHFSHQHVGRLGTRRDLFHEIHVNLKPKRKPMELRDTGGNMRQRRVSCAGGIIDLATANVTEVHTCK